MDPRAERTREHVLRVSQEILAESGADALTFAAVAERARVARQTLYRHWGTPQNLLGDALMRTRAPAAESDSSGRSAEEVVYDDLKAIDQFFADASNEAALAGLIGHATHDPAAERVLRDFTDGRKVVLERLLGPLDPALHAAIVGPLFFSHLVARRRVDDQTLRALARQATQLLKNRMSGTAST